MTVIGCALTSSTFVNPIEGDAITVLREADQGEEDIELVPVEGDIAAAARREDTHDARLVICAQLGGCQRPRDAPGCNSSAASILGHDRVKGGDITLRDVGA